MEEEDPMQADAVPGGAGDERGSATVNTEAIQRVAQAGKGPGTRGRGWKTALLLGGSVMLGAAAVALWNRRSVAKLRRQARELQ